MTHQKGEVPEDTTGYENPHIKNYREVLLNDEKVKKPAFLLAKWACM